MKSFTALTLSLLFSLLLATSAFAAFVPLQVGVPFIRDASSTNIPTTYTTGAEIGSGIANKGQMCWSTTITTWMWGTFSTTANCVGASNQFFIPASSSGCVPLKSEARVCLKSYGSAISTGFVGLLFLQ